MAALVVIVSGVVDLSAAKPHPEGWADMLHYVFKRSTAFHAYDGKPPADLDSPMRIAAGAAYYGQVCARCHGGPGLGQNPVVLSMHPRPQYLASELRRADGQFTPQQLFRIVQSGVKYSAMPAWPVDGRDDEVWHMVAFLRALPTMSPQAFRALAVAAPTDAKPLPFGVPTKPQHYALRNDKEPPVGSESYTTPAFGFAGFALGNNPVQTCSRCHGSDGAGGGVFPNITLQNADYLRRTLTAFANGDRRSGFMQVIASELSPSQIDGLAKYYAAMPRRSTDARSVKVSILGQDLALRGNPKAGLGPCAGCHGINRDAAKAYPLLEGQSRWYLANQLRLFRSGGRGGIAGANPMSAVAHKLDDKAIDAVSSYYAAQPPALVQSFAAIEKTR